MTFSLVFLLIAICVIFLVLVIVISTFFFLKSKTEKFLIPPNGFFGPGEPKPDDIRIQPFKVTISKAQIDELKKRLNAARIGHKELEDVADWSYGVRVSELEKWRKYWAEQFNFDGFQAELNKFPQFATELEGLKVHFLHVKPPRPSLYRRVMPLLLAHGWPGGVYEFYQLIPMLADPKAHSIESEIAFELVVPSIPGYGFSEQPHKKGFDFIATARLFHRLMVERIGHGHYLAQGGDWGSMIVSMLGRLYPQNVLGIHLNVAFIQPFLSVRHFIKALIGCYFPSLVFSEPEHFQHYSISAQFKELLLESGYYHIQATKPDTVGVALNDSPIGLLAYIVEKFSTWTNPAFLKMSDGGLLKKYTFDQVLTLISVYWFQGNILSSQRYYKENIRAIISDEHKLMYKYVTVPTAYAAFPNDFGGPQPRELLKLTYNLTQMTILPDGGHFAALELPKELAKDVVKFGNALMNKL